ncbi:metallophosphoesterase [Arsukibacterium indicum]|uniref:Metallophosphoesterase n=1 Tax=Arsukibacterium indicum TaxID=2848612 RepID=A0ABS6MK60_9GAMM|nr:metallophosphoesterase [Arsukibacterium indicum]MBV2129213.1 metallophosphoesterase [Arsukibacterium indicum]
MKTLLKVLVAMLLVLLAVLLSILANATVELTKGGVYSKVYLPIVVGEIKWNAAGSVQASAPAVSGLQGPVIVKNASTLQLTAWCQDERITQELPLAAVNVQLDCQDRHYHYQLAASPLSINAEIATPPAVAVISDLEGNIAFFEHWARNNGVTDANGDWQFGNGQLIVLGDAVDRGRQVYELLWRLYQLAQQAQQHGGQLLLLHGNHEQYVMRGLVDRVETEHFWAIEQLMPYEQSFAADTVLGGWLRQQPVIARMGNYLFTHGGVSPQVLASGLTVAQLNQRYHATLQQTNGEVSEADYALFYGSNGLSQYRALLSANNDGVSGGDWPEAHLQQILAHFNVKALVIGHTPVAKPAALFDGRLLAVEAEQTSSALIIRDGEAEFIDVGMVKNRFTEQQHQYRSFRLLSGADWRALMANKQHLSDLNHAKTFFNREKPVKGN